MAAKTDQNFDLTIGEDLVVTFDVSGTGVNLTGGSVSWVMSAHPLSAAAATLTVAGSISDSDTFTVTLADTDTDSINSGVYFHESKFTDGAGLETVVATGYANLKPSTT